VFEPGTSRRFALLSSKLTTTQRTHACALTRAKLDKFKLAIKRYNTGSAHICMRRLIHYCLFKWYTMNPQASIYVIK
jgi:hypothetical protein